MVSEAPLTRRQANILAFITGLMRIRGYPPSLREIGSAFAIRSPNGVMCHLRALEKKGCIVRGQKTARAISLPKAAVPVPTIEVPIHS